jgi:hypothetical protein
VETEVVALLRAHGLDTFFASYDIRTTAAWERKLRQALITCDWFLLVMTQQSAQSDWVEAEVHWAMDERRDRFVPVLVEPCDPMRFHLKLRQLQHVDYATQTLPEARRRLLAAWGLPLDPALREGPLPIPRPDPPQPAEAIRRDSRDVDAEGPGESSIAGRVSNALEQGSPAPAWALECRGVPNVDRLFLIGGSELWFGRNREDRARDLRNDVLLRVLPCRSAALDPDNWRKTTQISKVHGVIRIEEDRATLTDFSSRGTRFMGQRLQTGLPTELSGRFHLDVADGALEFDGRMVRTLAAPAQTVDQVETTGLDPVFVVATVILSRKGNTEGHHYALVNRSLSFGGDPNCDVMLGEGVPSLLFRIVRSTGVFLIESFFRAPPPRRGQGWLGLLRFGRDRAATLTLDGEPLNPGKLKPLGPGAEIRFEDIRLTVVRADDEHFTQVDPAEQ